MAMAMVMGMVIDMGVVGIAGSILAYDSRTGTAGSSQLIWLYRLLSDLRSPGTHFSNDKVEEVWWVASGANITLHEP